MGAQQKLPLHRWSTLDEQQPLRRRDLYADALATALTPMRVWVREVESFNAHYLATDLGPLTILRMTGVPHRVDRGSREIERSGTHTFHLLTNLASRTHLTHRGEAAMGVGDAFLVDSQLPYQLDCPHDYNVVHVKMAEEWVRGWLPAPLGAVGRQIARDSGWSGALCAFLAQLSPEFIVDTPLPLTVISDQIGALLALAAIEITGGSPAPRPAERDIRERIRDCIVERCADSSLTAADVALALNISTRTLHRSLASFNQTFGASLISARVELASRMLRSRIFKRLTTAEIGRRAGFVNASHFARVVHRHCGMKPSEMRRVAAEPTGFVEYDSDTQGGAEAVKSAPLA